MGFGPKFATTAHTAVAFARTLRVHLSICDWLGIDSANRRRRQSSRDVGILSRAHKAQHSTRHRQSAAATSRQSTSLGRHCSCTFVASTASAQNRRTRVGIKDVVR